MKNFKTRFFWVVLAMQLALSLHAQSVRVMTYNIRLDVASDGENDWTHRRDFVVSQIKFYAPDIFGTQEGLPHQIDYLQKNLGPYAHEGIGREGVGKGESTAIFYDQSKFLVTQSHTFWLSPTPDTISMGWDAACLRVCTAVLLKNRQTRQDCWVFNTHLDHVGEVARAKGIDLILTKIKALNTRQLPVVFMGDLNAEPETAIITGLKKELLDAREASEAPPFGPDGSFNAFKFDQPVTRLIDYIFVSRSPAIRVKKYAVLSDSKNLRYPSDHLPVLVELDFLKP